MVDTGHQKDKVKPQRIRCPVHDLIEFTEDPFDQKLWGIVQTQEFQRLRRIRQLGFSELVYPGATHTRFAHSLGVFQVARLLLEVVKRIRGCDYKKDRAERALCAALVHDIGHGPFSHAFETALRGLGFEEKHEFFSKSLITSKDTDIGTYLEKTFDTSFAADVAAMVTDDSPKDIYASIVSSQIDADRLDYMCRDRKMTGVHHGHFDLSWILANVDIASVSKEGEGEGETDTGETDCFVFKYKAKEALESYLLGLFHLYQTVYFHKTTRSAENMMSEIISRIGHLCKEKNADATGLPESHPLRHFFTLLLEVLKTEKDKKGKELLNAYTMLDDSVFLGALPLLEASNDICLKTLSARLRRRDLYKVIDLNAEFGEQTEKIEPFAIKLEKEMKKRGPSSDGAPEFFVDGAKRVPYANIAYGAPESLKTVHIRRPDGRGTPDVKDLSSIVKNLERVTLFRVFVRDTDAYQTIRDKIKNEKERS